METSRHSHRNATAEQTKVRRLAKEMEATNTYPVERIRSHEMGE
jgi:hypothetical protein